MITDMILHKYLRHLRYIDQGSIVHIDAVELALRLALDELEQSIASTPSTPPTELATLQAELERLQTAANAEVAELKQQMVMQARQETIKAERSALAEALRRGLVSEEVYQELIRQTDNRAAALNILRRAQDEEVSR